MCLERVSVIAVCGESLSTLPFAVLVRGYKLCNAWKSISEWRYVITQVNQQVARPDRRCVASDRHRRFQPWGPVRNQLVRDEAAIAKCPEKFVDVLGIHAAARVNMHGICKAVGFLSQSAGEKLAFARPLPGQNVKIDPGHYGKAPERAKRSSVNIGTGLPEAPFCLPDFHAVPAISR